MFLACYTMVRQKSNCLIGLVCLALCQLAWGQTSSPPSANNPTASPALSKSESGPPWPALTPAQQQVLNPIQHLWPSLDENRKRKWLVIASNFPKLSPESQVVAQQRMREWAALSPAQRAQARLNFAQSQELSIDEKKAKWEAFQSLNEDEKIKLFERKPAPLKGAATASKPVSPDKLTATPKAKAGQEKAPRIETTTVDPQTLLPIKKASESSSQP